MYNGWLNIYKPKGISSAKVVAIIKKICKGSKVGHAGTLDIEAEGILPIAIGEATKLMQFLVSVNKHYIFTIKFGARTTTDDYNGQIIETTDSIPLENSCYDICKKFTGAIEQVPSAFSAIKVNGVRSYKIARKNYNLILPSREIYIYNLNCINFNLENQTATFITECSKGTYIRTLAKDISLSLQSLGFVIELQRIQVGTFKKEDSFNVYDFEQLCLENPNFLGTSLLKIETILNDIPALDIDQEFAKKIKFGQQCVLSGKYPDQELLWMRYQNRILAIGSIKDNCFKPKRVFNLISIH